MKFVKFLICLVMVCLICGSVFGVDIDRRIQDKEGGAEFNVGDTYKILDRQLKIIQINNKDNIQFSYLNRDKEIIFHTYKTDKFRTVIKDAGWKYSSNTKLDETEKKIVEQSKITEKTATANGGSGVTVEVVNGDTKFSDVSELKNKVDELSAKHTKLVTEGASDSEIQRAYLELKKAKVAWRAAGVKVEKGIKEVEKLYSYSEALEGSDYSIYEINGNEVTTNGGKTIKFATKDGKPDNTGKLYEVYDDEDMEKDDLELVVFENKDTDTKMVYEITDGKIGSYKVYDEDGGVIYGQIKKGKEVEFVEGIPDIKGKIEYQVKYDNEGNPKTYYDVNGESHDVIQSAESSYVFGLWGHDGILFKADNVKQYKGEDVYTDGRDWYDHKGNKIPEKVAKKESLGDAKEAKSNGKKIGGDDGLLDKYEDAESDIEARQIMEERQIRDEQYGINNWFETGADVIMAGLSVDFSGAYGAFMSDEAFAEAKAEYRDSFLGKYFSVAGLAATVCDSVEQMPLPESDGAAVVAMPDGTYSVAASIQGKISQRVYSFNETTGEKSSEYLYKITYAIKNPTDDDEWYYNVVFDDGTEYYDGYDSVPPGETVAYTKKNMIVFYESEKYERLCLVFQESIQGIGNKVCNKFVDEAGGSGRSGRPGAVGTGPGVE